MRIPYLDSNFLLMLLNLEVLFDAVTWTKRYNRLQKSKFHYFPFSFSQMGFISSTSSASWTFFDLILFISATFCNHYKIKQNIYLTQSLFSEEK